MIFVPRQLGKTSLTKEEIIEDKKKCRKFGPCGVGEKAIYVNSFYISRRFYIPFDSVKRVFKRIAMSKGGFSGKGIFATLPYLVVEYDDGEQKQCNFKYEEQVDQLIAFLQGCHPEIPTHSLEAEKLLAEKAKRRAAKKKRIALLTPEAEESLAILERSITYLKKNPELYTELSIAAKKKRTFEKSNPAYRWVALFIILMGIASIFFGIYALTTRMGYALYFLLFGLGALFLFSSAHVLPTAKNNRKAIDDRFRSAVEAMEGYVAKIPDFPVPAWYAHINVLKGMKEILLEGRAKTLQEALEILKTDLKALNSSVTVEQEEYDEIMSIKPLFLVMDYK